MKRPGDIPPPPADLADGTHPGSQRVEIMRTNVTLRAQLAPAEKPCSARMRNGGWCLARDGHSGPHAGVGRARDPVPSSALFGPQHIAEANARRGRKR